VTDLNLDAQNIAEQVAVGMMARDRASRGLGMEVIEISPGLAVLKMTVRESMLNGLDTCHGGYITVLADSAFAFACNSYNQLTVASSLSIEFIAPVYVDEVLTARAVEVSRSGRTGIYDVDISNAKGVRVAIFRGRSYQFKDKPLISI
jgi:acyl-CoA thioesterase